MSAVAAVSSSVAASAQAPAGLDEQKAKVQKQLADCVNCSSSKTPEGQAKITALSSQLAAVEARMQKADETRAQSSKAAAVESAAAPRAASDADSQVGRNVDVFA